MNLSRPLLHRARLAVAVLFWPMLGLVIWGQLSPQPPEIVREMGDKPLHFLAYFCLGAIAAAAIRNRSQVLWAALALVLFGGMMEILQGLTGRDTSFMDEIVNIGGILSGCLAARMFVEPLRRRFTAY